MKNTDGSQGFSPFLAAASGLAALASGLAGALIGAAPAVLIALAAAAAIGVFGKRLASISLAAKPKPEAPEAKGPPIPDDRVDPLTGLANANGLAAWFRDKSRRLSEDQKSIFVMLADLDKLDEIERIRGRQTAEAVIKEVAKRVAGFGGADGIAARTGEDEFVAVAAVVPAKAYEIAEESAGKLAETICRPVDLGAGTLWIGGAVGAAVGAPGDSEAVLARAKAALEKARRLGLGRFWVDGGK